MTDTVLVKTARSDVRLALDTAKGIETVQNR